MDHALLLVLELRILHDQSFYYCLWNVYRHHTAPYLVHAVAIVHGLYKYNKEETQQLELTFSLDRMIHHVMLRYCSFHGVACLQTYQINKFHPLHRLHILLIPCAKIGMIVILGLEKWKELKGEHFTLNVTNAKVFSFGFLTETSGPAWRNNSLKSFNILILLRS